MMAPHIDVGIRIQCLVLLEWGVPIDLVSQVTNVHKASIYRFRRIAIERGYDPAKSRQILLKYLEDAPRSGRPTVCTQEVVDKVIANVSASIEGRYKTTAQIGYKLRVGATSIQKILKSEGFHKVKRTMKPGLTQAMKEARLQFALRYEHWTLEMWKAVI
jgi:Transposase